MNSLELFSGAGGLAKGLELAGFKHAALVENNKHAYASLCENFDAEKVFFGDVRDFDLETLDNIDLVAGGPPCQPFSIGSLVIKSMTTPIFPANCPIGTSSRLFNFLNNASKVEPSHAQTLSNFVLANSRLCGNGRCFRLCHFVLNSGNNSLNTLSNNSAGKVKNL